MRTNKTSNLSLHKNTFCYGIKQLMGMFLLRKQGYKQYNAEEFEKVGS